MTGVRRHDDRPAVVHVIASPVRSAPRVLAHQIVAGIDRDRFAPAVAFVREGVEESEEYGFGHMLDDFADLDIPMFVGTMERSWHVHDAVRLDRFLRDLRAKLIVSHLGRADMWATVMSWWGRAHYIRLLHGGWDWWAGHTPDVPLGHMTDMMRLADRQLLRFPDRIACVSPDTLETLVAQQGVPRERIKWIRTGIDIEHFRAPHPPLQDGSAPVFGMLSRVREQKGVFEFVAAIAALQRSHPEVRAVVYGEGPDLDPAKSAAADAGARIEFPGHVTDVPAALAAIDVFVLPSWYEGTPLSVLEAMAAGRVMIVSDVGGMPYVCEDGRSGFVVPPRDASALESAMRRVVAEPDQARRFASAALADSDQYTIPQMWQTWNDLYAEVLQDNSRGRA